MTSKSIVESVNLRRQAVQNPSQIEASDRIPAEGDSGSGSSSELSSVCITLCVNPIQHPKGTLCRSSTVLVRYPYCPSLALPHQIEHFMLGCVTGKSEVPSHRPIPGTSNRPISDVRYPETEKVIAGHCRHCCHCPVSPEICRGGGLNRACMGSQLECTSMDAWEHKKNKNLENKIRGLPVLRSFAIFCICLGGG